MQLLTDLLFGPCLGSLALDDKGFLFVPRTLKIVPISKNSTNTAEVFRMLAKAASNEIFSHMPTDSQDSLSKRWKQLWYNTKVITIITKNG